MLRLANVRIGVGVALKMAKGSCRRKELARDGMNRQGEAVAVLGEEMGFQQFYAYLDGSQRQRGKGRQGDAGALL